MRRSALAIPILLSPLMTTAAAPAEPAVALYGGRTVSVAKTLADPTDLWIPAGELERVNGFELKPEGACYGDLCVPVKQDEDGPLFVTREASGWFNVSELARRLRQGEAHDADHRVWSFGEVPAVQQSYLRSATAPDFELPNRKGGTVHLSDFRGKKVLLMTWASW